MSNNACPFDHELLSRYVSCDCETEERMRVERHVRVCRPCRHELYELERVWSMLEEWQVDEAEAPFRPEVLRTRLKTEFGKPQRFAWTRDVFSSLWGWGILKPAPVAVMVGMAVGLLALWDTVTGPDVRRSAPSVARLEPSPTAVALRSDTTETAEPIDIERILHEMDQSARNLNRIQNVVGVRLDGRPEDMLSTLNRPSTPLPSAPPQTQITFASAHGRL